MHKFLEEIHNELAEIFRYITEMLKKDNDVKWTAESREAFNRIKSAFAEAPVLASLEYSKPFMIFSFASPHTVAAVLL